MKKTEAMGRVMVWYSVCVVVGAAYSWLGGFFVALVITGALLLCGLAMAFASGQPQMLPMHHAFIGLAVSLSFSLLFPLAVFAVGPSF